MTERLAVVVALAAAGVASADAPRPAAASPDDPPDPAVREAGDANLESTADRRGLTVSGSIGGGLLVGFGIDDSVGRGGALSLRIGHVATPRTVITFELGVNAVLHKPKDLSVQTDTDTNLLAGAQHYVGPSLWLRYAGGVGVYQRRGILASPVQAGGEPPTYDDVTLIGPAVLAGIGLDVARLKWAVLGIEAGASAMVNRDGVLVASHLNLGLAFD